MARDLLDRINDSTYGPAPVLLLIPTTRISFFFFFVGPEREHSYSAEVALPKTWGKNSQDESGRILAGVAGVCVCTQMRVDVGHCGCSSNRWQRSSRILTSWRLEWAEVVGVWESRVVAFKRRQLDFMCTVHSIRWPPQGGMYASWIGLGDSGVHLFFYFFRTNDIDCKDYLDRKFPVFRWGRWWEWWMLDCRAAESLIGSLLLLSSRLWRVSSCVSSA